MSGDSNEGVSGAMMPGQDEVNLFLDELRESGVTNMYGAGPYIMEMFSVDRATAHKMLAVWMLTFSERHPQE